MAQPKKIVVVGGTGNFGSRICHRLLGQSNTVLVVTSRSLSSAKSLATRLHEQHPGAIVDAAALDQSSPGFAESLKQLGPDIVIHTAGPYQGQDYRVARACIACASHYIDLADGREFVSGFDVLHNEASRRGVLLVSGASTLPGLSSAVVEQLRGHFATIHGVEISIAPAHQTPRGSGTVAAVLSYCGKPFDVMEDGNWVTRFGWQNLKAQRYPELGFRISAACDVPDLGLLPELMPEVETVTFHAALEAKWEQIALWKMAWATRLGIVSDWDRFIPAFQWLSNRLIKLGSVTGGMQVRLSGVGQDRQPMSIAWNLVAQNNHGPEIPCIPALILARKLASDQIAESGARACVGMITLSEFDAEVSDLSIRWKIDMGTDE